MVKRDWTPEELFINPAQQEIEYKRLVLAENSGMLPAGSMT